MHNNRCHIQIEVKGQDLYEKKIKSTLNCQVVTEDFAIM